MTGSSLNGIGVQNLGSGPFHVGRDLTISVRDKDQCLAHLYSTDPTHDKKRIEDTKGGLLRDSYRWILDHNAFKQWRDGENPLLWIKGDPGKGKTMLLCGIIDELTPSTKLANKEMELLLSYFFCQATDSRLNNATSVLRGLIWQLAKQQPVLVEHIWKDYDRKGKTVFEDANAWVALSEILTNMMQDPSFQRAYLVIDALDECTIGLPGLLKFIISQSAAFSGVKWVVASRNWPEIEEPFNAASQKVKLCLELNASSISAAVSIYIDRKIDELAQLKRYNKETRDAVFKHLSSNADDTFLWVALVCHHLATISKWDVLRKLYTIPSGLDGLYQQMMRRVLNSENSKLCKRILAIISTVFQPITTTELGCFVETFQDINDNEYLVYIINLCGSFLTVRERTIYFVHQSAKDFLLRIAADEIMLSGTEQLHHQILSASLKVMSKTLCRDVYKLRLPGISINQVKQPESDPLAAVRYSCIYWVDHLQACPGWNVGDIRDEGPVNTFMRQTYLYWLEALSLFKSMSAGVFAMEKLDGLLRDYKSQLANLVSDQHRFIQYHRATIENNPLQLYISALLFSPYRSITRELFKHTVPEWVITKPIVEDDWSACLQTFEGHKGSIDSVVFSPDGQLLASASWDYTIKIWDRIGACLQTFKDHTHRINSVVFSPDSQLLASASDDRTIKLWDRTGTCLQILESHTRSIKSVVFSPDGQLLASASHDRTIKLWDRAGACLQTFKGHMARINLVVFSRDGQLLASASDDCTIKLWDRTGACLQTFEGHTSVINSVVFSPDGQLLASASADHTIKLWDRTGAYLQTFEGHTHRINSVVFSPDGQLLASASNDHTIKLWDRTGACLRTFKGHIHLISSVVFSPDGQLLASVSYDYTIKLWDRTGACLQTFKVHTIGHLSFDSSGRSLRTSRGTSILNIPAPFSPPLLQKEPRQRCYRVNAYGTWIMRDNEEILYLPLDYRPKHSDVVGSKVGIATRSNRVILLEFSDKLMA